MLGYKAYIIYVEAQPEQSLQKTKLMFRAAATDGSLEGLMMQENRMAVTRPNRLDGGMRSEHSMISVRSAKLAGRRHRVGRCVCQCQ